MYKATVRALIRHGIRKMNEGDPEFFLRLAAPEATLRFPGDNSWARMFRPVEKGRAPHATHRGVEECRAFAERFVAAGLQLYAEDILVNGPPWHIRVAVRGYDFLPGPDGVDEYNNRVVACMEIRWGRLVTWEDYEDTERVSAWDERRATDSLSAPAGWDREERQSPPATDRAPPRSDGKVGPTRA